MKFNFYISIVYSSLLIGLLSFLGAILLSFCGWSALNGDEFKVAAEAFSIAQQSIGVFFTSFFIWSWADKRKFNH